MNRDLEILKTFCRWAVGAFNLPEQNAKTVRGVKKLRENNERVRALTTTEGSKLLAALNAWAGPVTRVALRRVTRVGAPHRHEAVRAEKAWPPLFNVERLRADIHGLRRGTVAVEGTPVQTNGLPNIAPVDAFDAWVFSTNALARACTMPSAPHAGPKYIETMRAALRRLGEALEVAEARRDS